MSKKLLLYCVLLGIVLIITVTLAYWKHQNDLQEQTILNQDETPISDSHEKIVFNKDDVTLVTTLKSKDGSVLGNVYVTYFTKDIFSSLYVVKEIDGKNAIVYKIDADGFYNTLGRELGKGAGDFYGYQFAMIKDGYFVLHQLADEGRSISDDYTIVWSSKKSVFEIQRPDPEDLGVPSSFIGTLKTKEGSVLGELEGSHPLDKDTFASLYVVRKSYSKMESIYLINNEGFSNKQETNLEVPQENLYGFRVVLIKDDYFVVRIITNGGKNSSEDITVKWNYEKNVFEIK